MKSLAAVEALLMVGMAAIAATMFIQIPKEVEQLTELTTLSSASAVAKDISGLITTSTISPGSITILYTLPEKAPYTISISGYYVKVTSTSQKPEIKAESSTEGIPFKLEPKEITDVKILEITKTMENGQNKYEVKKYA